MNKVNCVVPVSGGKDSQLCLKLAVEKFGNDSVVGLFCDTFFEHPKTYDHLKFISELYDVKIHWLQNQSVSDLVVKYNRFPHGLARFCTSDIKITPSKKWYAELATRQGGFEVWYGMRRDESVARSKRYSNIDSEELYEPHEILPSNYPKKLGRMGVRFKLPIINMTEIEVMNILAGTLNPLYAEGFDRVGCFPCLAAGSGAQMRALSTEFGSVQQLEITRLESQIGKRHHYGKKAIKECSFCKI